MTDSNSKTTLLPPLSRRSFFRISAAGAVVLTTGVRGTARARAEETPASVLAAGDIPQFVTPLLIPPAMPRTRKLRQRGGKNIDYYEIAVRQFRQQVLPDGFPETTVWGYGTRTASGVIFSAPSATIEAKWNSPVRVRWINELTDLAGRALPHLLPVDPTLHWANPPGGVEGRDRRPEFTTTPGPYTGPVPIVTHLHGAEAVGDESDGYAEAWYLPDAGDIPSGYAVEGTWYSFFRTKAAQKLGVQWSPGSATFQYPNTQRATALWYHDHTLGLTRVNVYAGPAGFYLLRGGPSDDVRDSRTGAAAVLPGPAPALGDAPGLTYYEIPLAIQDRAFRPDGQLFYPDSREYFDGIAGPYVPDSDVSPIWNPEFFGNTIIVNGATWPFLDVEQRRYRFRLLNGCNSRFLILDFSQIAGVKVWQIGSDGGYLPAPVDLAARGRRLLMAPAERADVIVDFTDVPIGPYVLGNLGPDEPFGGGEPDEDFDVADPNGTGHVLQFRVHRATSRDLSTPPQHLQLPPVVHPAGGVTRRLALIELMSTNFDGPAEARLGQVMGDPSIGPAMVHDQGWPMPVTENPSPGDTELWEFYNTTADAHPMHVHDVQFAVVDRQPIEVTDADGEPMGEMEGHGGMEAGGTVHLVGTPRPPEPNERGFKDTVTAYSGEVTRVRMRFANAGQFVWHCHIVEHEDNEMMRPFRIGPPQAGEPSSGHMH
jgi:FtsP/CotA-like multicopper oxidase with cupredoxin domain